MTFNGRPIDEFFFTGKELEELGLEIVSKQPVSWCCAEREREKEREKPEVTLISFRFLGRRFMSHHRVRQRARIHFDKLPLTHR